MCEGLGERIVARRMGLTTGQVRLLVAQEEDHRELKAFKRDSIDTAAVRAFVDKTLEPGVTRGELAHWLNMEQIDLDRQLGYTAGKNGKIQRRVQIPTASRVVIALGRAPYELDGC
jgi:hypothetical protein